MQILDDADSEHLDFASGRALAPADREAFRRAAEAALARVPCWSEGAVYRAVVLQRQYFVPIDDGHAHWDISHERPTPPSSFHVSRSNTD